MVKTPQAIAILDSRDRQQAALDQAQEQVRLAEANLAKVKAGAKNGEIQAQKATIARIRADRSNEITAQRSLREEKSIAAPPLQRNKPQLRA
jgi:HlyD family secretion protein